MRLKITESKNAKSLYVIRSTYENGKHSSEIVEKLGTYAEILKKLDGNDPIVWAKAYIKELNEKELSVFNVLLWMCKSESQRHLNNYSVTLSFGFNSISRWFDADKIPTHYIYNRVRDVTIYRDDISDPVVFVKQFLEFCK